MDVHWCWLLLGYNELWLGHGSSICVCYLLSVKGVCFGQRGQSCSFQSCLHWWLLSTQRSINLYQREKRFVFERLASLVLLCEFPCSKLVELP